MEGPLRMCPFKLSFFFAKIFLSCKGDLQRWWAFTGVKIMLESLEGEVVNDEV